jgi:hypothetical protein
MSRWLFLSSCLLVLGAVAYSSEPARRSDARELGAACGSTQECQVGLRCGQDESVLATQCSASCNETTFCQEHFGAASVCLGADLCARTCSTSADCPAGTACNVYGWCEKPNTSSE